ncbi:class I SAM-dependent methyltransferase [Streptomyces sp. DSM 44915]|uniref:Class I SAM-dependent methyltransferase n=1 Tax=Streptomyces chisholmiae TaxID=3075540 RepID=A0ABU2JJW7_9ACTN|nr:class I SAM-dependent methyltransferase [Streptomyces sp. DSM 44915]MDT0265277.1 class I SAM-dependent methyltransferase [Streptomyces sp. DSM 44915]
MTTDEAPYQRHLITHAEHPIAAPLSEESVAALLRRALADRAGPVRLLDLGCGQAAWPLRALAAHPTATAVGVDLDPGGLAHAAAEAARLGVADRLTLVTGDAAAFAAEAAHGAFDVVLSVGATHAFGGLAATLAGAVARLAPGGRLVLGECFWEREPTPAALTALGAEPADFTDLAGLVARCVEAGLTPVHGRVSTLDEWDDYEWCWTGSLAGWALDHPEHPKAAEAAATAAEHRAGWLGGYRGVLGFATLVLRG